MKIHPLGAKLFYEDIQINVTKQVIAFYGFAKVRDNGTKLQAFGASVWIKYHVSVP